MCWRFGIEIDSDPGQPYFHSKLSSQIKYIVHHTTPATKESFYTQNSWVRKMKSIFHAIFYVFRVLNCRSSKIHIICCPAEKSYINVENLLRKFLTFHRAGTIGFLKLKQHESFICTLTILVPLIIQSMYIQCSANTVQMLHSQCFYSVHSI